ncbi:MAG: translation initiation factor Sui1 [Pseudomonadales bacterium]|nr:translation initiation factor Sui1 [Pseudomonadales bacterium]
MSKNQRRVYSTDQGRICPNCNQAVNACRCSLLKKSLLPETDGVVRVSRETKGRKGKGVTLVAGVPLSEPELKALAKRLRTLCGTGGTLKGGVIELQGDHCAVLLNELSKNGWVVKRSGG